MSREPSLHERASIIPGVGSGHQFKGELAKFDDAGKTITRHRRIGSPQESIMPPLTNHAQRTSAEYSIYCTVMYLIHSARSIIDASLDFRERVLDRLCTITNSCEWILNATFIRRRSILLSLTCNKASFPSCSSSLVSSLYSCYLLSRPVRTRCVMETALTMACATDDLIRLTRLLHFSLHFRMYVLDTTLTLSCVIDDRFCLTYCCCTSFFIAVCTSWILL